MQIALNKRLFFRKLFPFCLCISLFAILSARFSEVRAESASAEDDQTRQSMADQSAPDTDAPVQTMDLDHARQYWLYLVNRDRSMFGLAPVQLDPIATKAGQWHADEMASKAFNSHWHPDGKKPPQRYTECGGMDYVGENSHGTSPNGGWQIKVAQNQAFTAKQVEDEEKCYFNELPPNDGHRKNILGREHTHVGLGLTAVDLYHKGSDTEAETTLRQLTSAQEFINKYGEYSASSDEFVKDTPYVFSGRIAPYLSVQSVQVLRENLPEPINQSTLSEETTGPFHGGYTLPDKNVLSAFPMAFAQKPEAKLMQQGNEFRCELTPPRKWKPGLYYVFLWVQSGKAEAFPISMRTIPLNGKK